METIQSIYPYLIAVALTAMTYIYRSYIKNLISKPATIEKNLFFKRTPWPTKPVNTAATTQKVTVFKESISQITFHISGKGARVYKSYYEGQQNIKLEHSRQKALFCETNLTITNKIDASKAVKKFSN